MLTEELMYDVLRHFAFNPTDDQMFAADIFSRFMTDRDERCVMILRGSAGTGKTSLAGAIVRTMMDLKQRSHSLHLQEGQQKCSRRIPDNLQQQSIVVSIVRKPSRDWMVNSI